MLILMIIASILFLLTSLVMTLAMILSKKSFMDREKNSPFECGFDPKSSARMPFSLQFFLIAVIFLIFDVEITLMIPFVNTMNITNMFNFMMIFNFFMIILLLGLYHEWTQGALNWLN
uniref:NADH-ubiquinone oxidoreductase chain 3 n=1 Tax=Staphylinoidea sp. 14 KM-2017 TaxID=2219454 RepID=A0A346RJ29_9COLE|nr:NADH dehydrogenase subunit 3 [Staphylinoidea sp. 14 KM-2017]